MITLITVFLRSHWLGTLTGLIATSILALIGFQHIEISHLSAKLALCHAENNALENSNKALVASIREQNAAIATVKAEADKKTKAAADALARARKNTQKYIRSAAHIKSQPLSGNGCADMKALLDNYIRNAP